MKCNLEGHRSLFLQYAACLPRLVFLLNGGYTPQTDSQKRLSRPGPAPTLCGHPSYQG
jgi:hypothetical protein